MKSLNSVLDPMFLENLEERLETDAIAVTLPIHLETDSAVINQQDFDANPISANSCEYSWCLVNFAVE